MEAWIGVDLDGTLAYYDGWKGHEHIGEILEPMEYRIRYWLKHGTKVKIFTARASVPEHKAVVEKWLEEHDLGGLEVTNVKDYGCLEIWDDRAVQIEFNTGNLNSFSRYLPHRKPHIDDDPIYQNEHKEYLKWMARLGLEPLENE